MKKPKPRDFGLDSDHEVLYADMLSLDPEQPLTQDELHAAFDALVEREATRIRQNNYANAIAEWNYGNGGR